MKTRKTIWLLVLAAVLLLALPISALSEETGEIGEDGGTWSFEDGVLTFSGIANLEDFWPESELEFYEQIRSVEIGPQVTEFSPERFSGCPLLNSFSADSANPYYLTEGGVLYNKDRTHLLGVPVAKTEPLNIPEGVTSISSGAFRKSRILQVNLPDSLEMIESEAFTDAGIDSISIPAGVNDISSTAFYCCDLSSISVDTGNQTYSSENGVLFDKEKTTLLCYPAGKADNRYMLPAGVVRIESNAFYEAKYLKEITLFAIQNENPVESLTEIGDHAFTGYALMTVHFPSTLTTIEDSAFQYCNYLTNLTYEGTAEAWQGVEIARNNTPLYLYPVACQGQGADPRPETGSIGEGVRFSLDYSNGSLVIEGAGEWNYGAFEYNDIVCRVTLCSGVTEIGDRGFGGCANLKEITIPDSVEQIGSEAFSECYSLTDITYGGTKADWEAMLDSREDEWIGWVIVHCTDGDIPAVNPLASTEALEFCEDGCPETIRLGEFFTIRVQPHEDEYSYSATLRSGYTLLTAWGNEDGIISFCTWPDYAKPGSYELTVEASSGRKAEATIMVTDYERPAAPEMQMRVLKMNGDEPDVIYANTDYNMEVSWNNANVTHIRYKNCGEDLENRGTTGSHIVDEEYHGENQFGILFEMITNEEGPEYFYVSACIDGVWSLWSDPLVLYPAEKPILEKPEITFVGKDEPYEYSLGEDVVFSVTLDPNTDYIDYYVNNSDDEEVYSAFDVRTEGNQTKEFTIDSDLLDGDTYTICVKCFNGNDEFFGPSSSRESFTVTGSRPDGPTVELDRTDAQFGDVLYATVYTDGAEEVVIEPPYGVQTVWLTDGQDTMVFPVQVQFYDEGTLRVRVRKNGVLSGWTQVEILSSSSPEAPEPWEVTFPDDIPGGTDVAVTVPEAYGAKYYMVWVYGGSDCLYWVNLEEHGTVTIPAVVFEDGGFYSIMAGASNGVSSDWCFKQEEYDNVPSYKSNRGLSVAATQQGEWPFNSTPSFTLTPGAGVTGTMTRVMVQELIDYSGSSLGPGTEWQIVTMTEAVSNQEYTNRVWLPAADTGAHQYRFAALVGGEWTDWSEPVTVTIGESAGSLDATDPIVPATIGLGQDLTVSWSAVDHAQYYNVYLTNLESNEHYIYETASTATTYTIDKSKLPAGSYGVKIEACADGYESSTGRTRMVRVVTGALALVIENSANYPAGLPVVVGGFRPAGTSGQESYEVSIEQNGTKLSSDTFEPSDVDDQGRIVLVPRGLEAGDYMIRATRHVPGEGDSAEATIALTVTGERPTVGELTVSGTEFYIPHGVDFRFSGDRYGQEAYCIIKETPDGQQAETLTENVNLWWLSDSGCIWSDYQYDPMQREYQFQLCCSDGRWTAWTDPVTVTWLSKGQASAPTLTGLEGSELLAGEPLILRGITLEENDGLPNYYDITLLRTVGDNDWEYVRNYSASLSSLNPDGSYTAELFGLDAKEDGSAQEYRLRAVHYRSGYVNSEETNYDFTVTGTRPPMEDVDYVFPAGTIQLNTEAYAEISAEGITGACATSRYSRSGEVYLPEGDTVYIPLDTSWADTREYLFRARIGTQWTEPMAYDVTVSGKVNILAKPKVTVPETFYIGRPMEVTIKPVANAEYYTVSVNRLNAEGEVSEGIYYDLVLEPDANGKALIPTLDFVDPGKYIFAFSACADGYDPGTSVDYIATGSFATNAPPAPMTECLTAAPAPRQDVDFRITTDPEADQVSLLVYLVYEEYGYQELLLNASLEPAGGTADYTLNYWLVGQGDYRVRASQRVNGEWSAYSACDFTVSGEAAEQLPPVTITSFPEEIISGEPFTVSWKAVEGAVSYVAEWRFNRDDVWTAVPLTGATSAEMTIDPAAAGMEYYCHVRISAYAPGKVGSTTEREAEILDSRVPTLAASRNQAAPGDEVILTVGNVFGDRLRVSVDNGKPELVYSRPMNEKPTFSLRLGKPGEHTIRVSCGVSEKYMSSQPEYWSCWSDAVTITVIDDTGLTPHTVTFEANGGWGRMENQTVYEETQLPLAANAFTRIGMYFDGWNTKADGSGTSYTDKQAVSLTEDTTLYAQWKIKDIHFSVDVIDQTSGVHMIGGKVRLSGTYRVDGLEDLLPPYEDSIGGSNYGAEGDVLLTLEAIPSANYSFVGWYSGEVLNAYDQTLTPVELLSEEPLLDLELTEHGYENCTMICAVYEYTPAYGTAAFRVPESLTVIPENAFENIGAATVYVPDTCTEIKDNAFKDCGQLRQIRLPKDCVINDDANPFAGCRTDPAELEAGEDSSDLLTIFAPAGGTTQTWAEEAGILFAAE